MTGELVLIVEDDANSRMLARDVLESRGYRTLESDTAEEGLRLAAAERPELILMDIQLPGTSGIEALHRLRGDPTTRAIPVIAVTASAMAHDRGRILAEGFDAYQTKPIHVKDFLATVRETLDRRGQGAPPA
jgi:CheY-like chemotaxis protein